MSLYQIVKILQTVSGSNAKTAILEANKENELLKAYLKAVYDPAVSYYQTKITKKTSKGVPLENYSNLNSDTLRGISHFLAERNVTGKQAESWLTLLHSHLTEESKELLELLIKRSIGAGVGGTMILNVFPELYFIPPYQRCSLMDDKIKAKFEKQEQFYVQLKLDGSFCYLVKEAGKAPEAITRAGSKYPAEFAQKLAQGLPDGFVVVGELLVYGEIATLGVPLDRKTGNGLLNSILKGGDVPHNLGFELTAWDCITIDEWKSGKSNTQYCQRLDDLDVALSEMSNAKAVTTHTVHSLSEAYKIYSDFTSQGFEGAVIKTTDFKWVSGTSKECIKLKIEFECDLKVIGMAEGTGKALGMMGSLTLASSDGKIVTDCGSGFTDEARKAWWSMYTPEDIESHNNIVTIKANDIISKKGSSVHSMFLPIFLELRHDKKEADSYERCVEQLEAAKGGLI